MLLILIKRFFTGTLTIFCMGLILSGAALASTISSVGSPNVEKNVLTAEIRQGYSADTENNGVGGEDARLRSRFHVDYGVTDYYAPRLVISTDRRKGGSLQFDTLTFENRFQFLKQKDAPLDFGIRLGYSLRDGDKKPDRTYLNFYERKDIGAWQFRGNQLFSHDVGEDARDGISAELRLQATYKVKDNVHLGMESFNNFGNLSEQSGYSSQEHSIGPVLKAGFGDGYGLETGYRAGLSRGALDHSFRVFLSKTF